MEVTNNIVLITGGTSGFGLEFAKQLYALGNTVIVTGRNAVKLEETKNKLPGIYTFQSDVSDPDAIVALYNKVVAQFPGINMLINNAGEMRRINLHDPSIGLNDITREIEINLCGPVRMVQQFLPVLKQQGSAAILNVSSGLALVPFPVSPVYGATKSGLHSYTRSLRVQLKNTNIQVFELLPPAAQTPLIDKFVIDMPGGSLMSAEKVVAAAILGMQQSKPEIYPGMSKAIRFFSRWFPALIFKLLSRPVNAMLAEK